MPLACYQLTITNAAGDIVPGALVEVRDEDTDALVTLKPNRDGSGTLGNPFAADAEGFARFFTAANTVRIRVTAAGMDRTHRYVVLLENEFTAVKLPVYQLATPSAGTTHDYAPSGFTGATTVLDLEPGAGDCEIGGLVGMTDGQDLVIRNAHASNKVKLLREAGGSTAANRFSLPYDLTLMPGGSVRGIYVAALERLVLCP